MAIVLGSLGPTLHILKRVCILDKQEGSINCCQLLKIPDELLIKMLGSQKVLVSVHKNIHCRDGSSSQLKENALTPNRSKRKNTPSHILPSMDVETLKTIRTEYFSVTVLKGHPFMQDVETELFLGYHDAE